MPKYHGYNDTVIGENIYVTYRKWKGKPKKLQTTGRHNAQQLTVIGNPATATIIKPLRWVK